MHKQLSLLFVILGAFSAQAQMITGVWQGKINGQRVEVKIVQKGDSLTGTSYYRGIGGYKRYSIKGYFGEDNSVIWWDDQVLNDRGAEKDAMIAVADFNCPGGGVMKLDGKASPKDVNHPTAPVALTKVPRTNFPDEWDYVIDNFTVGANDPDIIDSIALVSSRPSPKPPSIAVVKPPVQETVMAPPPTIIPAATSIEEKFVIRKKVFTSEIPITGDSIELRFYDNVQVDGDSITLFLNEKMIFTHIRLTEKAFTVKLAVKDLADTNELTMVAENLGSIPPNTAFLTAVVDGKYYNINLSSTEETSGMIRLKKPAS